MVDITGKPKVFREATATGKIRLKPETIKLIKHGKIEKGDPIYTAKIAGTLAAKETSILIPFCHPLPLTNVKVDIEIPDNSTVKVSSTIKTEAQTGVEMEALVATVMSLLTIWDMVKQYEKDVEGQYPFTVIEDIRVEKKVKERLQDERKRRKT
ncbi:MAG: cyclic pyranopterin monophosphate synthase MoaC [Candidatus Bathyarchaeota archaeon]|jgi:cyclic pyranopterin phosphate synthase|nr:cyclic pyranopterin monophosphate synthase MoaC [Candidatus Bathyarchaeota archaeon A05DMB-3]MDH7607118.1 cyclic pyranopterin monophosphate synthase MoaC [Candidatus Bathyarchaeota archaeon]